MGAADSCASVGQGLTISDSAQLSLEPAFACENQ